MAATVQKRRNRPQKNDQDARLTDEEGEAPTRTSGAVATTIAILRHLAVMESPAGVNAIARDLGIPPSSCFKILKHLQHSDLADFDEQTKCYSLGSFAAVLASRALDPANAFSLLRPQFEAFAAKYGVAIGLWRRISKDRMILSGFVEGSNPLRIHMTVGQRLPMLIGAVGRAFAAATDMRREDMEKSYLELRWQRLISFDEYCAQVEESCKLGYAVDVDNFALGVTTVAVTLRDPHGEIRYGVSAIRFSSQSADEEVRKIGLALMQMAEAIHARWNTKLK
ncbi:IclR family transcriptional regulator [Novosphingobium sp. KCTC 2891]|uniref:IclR family transcriptional regulator n=1 Tax=Novosphingobium sp. KCTC 2891 TaxID=2989730 RepID=UPI002221FDA7|nr:IclR family transcriptional regulator [Novosphingobium sp. KCTC 2891]MCW1384872.1 IclR family transcriptional regulator [Novosphingobium sp. KCTC 2891]